MNEQVNQKAKEIMEIAAEAMATANTHAWRDVYRLAFYLFELSNVSEEGNGRFPL